MDLCVKLKIGIPFAMQFKMYKDKIVHLQGQGNYALLLLLLFLLVIIITVLINSTIDNILRMQMI